MVIMESRCGSLPNGKPEPKVPEPQSPADFNETFPVTDRNVDFASGKSNIQKSKTKIYYTS